MNIQLSAQQLALRDELRAYFAEMMTPDLVAADSGASVALAKTRRIAANLVRKRMSAE